MKKSRNLIKYETKNPLKKFFIKKFLERIIFNIKILDNVKQILDTGCGEGFIIKKIENEKIKIDGLDISQNSLKIAKNSLPKNNFFLGDINRLPFNKNSYDLIIATEVLEHLKEPVIALEEIKRVTKNYVLISVPWEPFFSLGNVFSGKNLKRLGRDPEHYQFWNKKRITKLISQHFQVIHLEISFPWTIILAKKNEN